jgi:geranylgeranyl diphosphate synthase type I
MTIAPPTITETAPLAAPVPERFVAQVDGRLEALLDATEHRWLPVDDELGPPLRSLRRAVLGGGKRLRPTFAYWGWVAATGELEAGPDVVDTGAALELLHAFALVHDDVMDDADTRRGGTTTHVEHAATHRAGSWRGDHRRYGESIAILVGDLAHTLADSLVPLTVPVAGDVWRELQVELVLGQYLDVVRSAHGHAEADEARRIARLKSGRYTVEQPLRLGAALGGRLSHLDAALTAYGAPLGMAFQLRDDVLGAVGDDHLGKPVGGDIREGKPTALLASAREMASPAQARVLERVGAADLTDDEVGAIQEVLGACGALDAMRSEIDDLADAACGAIERAPIAEAAVGALVGLARFVVDRRS